MSFLLTLRSGLFLFLLITASVSDARTLIFQSQPGPSPEQTAPSASQGAAQQPSAVQYSTATVANSVAPSVNSELLFMIEQLQQEVRLLRGMVEEQAYQLRSLQDNSKARYRDLDSRVMELTRSVLPAVNASSPPSTPIHKAPTTGSSVVPVPNAPKESKPTEEQKIAYQAAYQLIKDRKFNEAVTALHDFIEAYPEGELTGNAYYWLGEVYLVLPQLEQAKQSFSIVVKSFPGHRKLPDAMFKLAVTHDRLQDPAGAETILSELQQKFPNSTAAKLAGSYKINR